MTHSTLSKISGLYVITDTNLMDQVNIVQKVEQAVQGGAKIVQFRDKISSFEIKLNLAKKLKTLCQKNNTLFIINDDIQLAKQVKADGVHIGKEDDDILEAKKQLGESAVIGVSCYNDIQRAQKMQNLGATYVAFGRFFPSKTKPHAPPADLSTIQQAKKQLKIPVVTIGGIDHSNAKTLIDAGADSIAVIQGVFAENDIHSAAKQLQNLFENH